ncbi:shikimate dehydrogenase family protein [Zongyangia hominis]|uniref:shikimate dehydrogenase (NADP(+)) n=1 Tax=Zongyangia hominis TaxID=2763677 RepID=A0A926ED20_9FIRM|nr:hypothetical protein [Zongyangia hominis]MBC8570835.1 hypothetical protein [Zongyangia hominis]
MRLKYDVDTKILFQIGDPLDQCCATYLHNALYEFCNVNAVNLSVPVPKGGLGDFVKAAKVIGAAGFDLTMPHKSAIIPFLDECDPASRAFKCVNHVKIREGKLIGVGLDGAGMGLSLQYEQGDIGGRHALMIGAGAVAGPIAADLCARGVKKFTIVNRTVEKAKYIADTLREIYGADTTYGPFTEEYLSQTAPDITLAVQCTCLGGGSHWQEFPHLGFVDLLPKECIAADVLYPTTTFLEAAKSRGLPTVSGKGMLYQQQLAMMEFYFGVKLGPDALAEAIEALEVAIALRGVRNERRAELASMSR